MSCSVEFAEYPSNLTLLIESGKEAVFRCRHQSTVADITWNINGSSIRIFPEIIEASENENGIRVDTVKIPTNREHNMTEVVCVAIFRGRDQESETPTALLVMQGYQSVLTCD